jgi:hypothetical protein
MKETKIMDYSYLQVKKYEKNVDGLQLPGLTVDLP